MIEASPMPWSVMRFSEEDEPDRIVDANGDEVAIELLEADAALIVAAVNERDDLVENLKTANSNRERESAEWVKFASALKAERDRLRDIVRRLAEQLHDAVRLTPYDAIARDLLREARAAIGEGAAKEGDLP